MSEYQKSESCVNSPHPSPMQYRDLGVMCNYRRLKFTRRFNNLPTNTTEDVSQHSFYTTILAMTMAEEYNKSVVKHNLEVHPYDVDNVWNKVNVHKVVCQALFHDIEEAFTSDIPWNVKHHTPDTSSTIHKVIEEKMSEVYSECSATFKDHWAYNSSAKSGMEGKFVAIADMLECAWNCHQEEQLGNEYLKEMKLKAIKIIEDDEFSRVLWQTSPLFRSMLNMLRGKVTYVGSDKMILD